MTVFTKVVAFPMFAATAVAARFRATPVIRAEQVPPAEKPEQPAEEASKPVIRIRLPGLPLSAFREDELPLLRKSVRIFRDAQAMLDPATRRMAYDILTRERVGRTRPTALERIDAIRLLMKQARR